MRPIRTITGRRRTLTVHRRTTVRATMHVRNTITIRVEMRPGRTRRRSAGRRVDRDADRPTVVTLTRRRARRTSIRRRRHIRRRRRRRGRRRIPGTQRASTRAVTRRRRDTAQRITTTSTANLRNVRRRRNKRRQTILRIIRVARRRRRRILRITRIKGIAIRPGRTLIAVTHLRRAIAIGRTDANGRLRRLIRTSGDTMPRRTATKSRTGRNRGLRRTITRWKTGTRSVTDANTANTLRTILHGRGELPIMIRVRAADAGATTWHRRRVRIRARTTRHVLTVTRALILVIERRSRGLARQRPALRSIDRTSTHAEKTSQHDPNSATNTK